MIQKKKKKKGTKTASSVSSTHPAIEISTLRDYHHFSQLTPYHEFALGGGVHLPLSPPPLRFIPLGFLHSGFMDFVVFDDVSSSYPAFALPHLEHLYGRQDSPQRPCHRRPGTRFAVRENISTGHGRFLYSLSSL